MIAPTALALHSRRLRGGVAGLVAVGAAAALSLATFSNPRFAHAVSDRLGEGLQGMKTVAAMLAERSPGARLEGALASLKHKRQAVLHERALPKVRGPYPGYEALAGPPPGPPVAPPLELPLYTAVAGAPIPLIPPIGNSGGPPVLYNIPLPGGGGGGGAFLAPIAQSTPEVPTVPVTPVTQSAVPEPSTWTMMILGFGLIGRMLGRRRAARTTSSLG